MSTGTEQLAETLAREGVRAIFGVPGSGPSYRLIAAMERRGLPFYGASHEGAAAIMAGSFGRQTDSIGCSISIKGPGLTNMLPGIASNHFEQLATISISEAVGPLTPLGRVHKRLDQKSLVSGVVKAYATPGDPAQTLTRLLACAREGIPGPVHLDMIAGDSASFVEFSQAARQHRAESTWRNVMNLVEGSSRPLLIVGALGRNRAWRARLAHLRVPVLTTLAAKGVLDEAHPHAAGVFTGDGKSLSPEHGLLREADLVIGLGLRNFEILNPAAISGRLIMLDSTPSDGSKGFAYTEIYSAATDAQFEELLRSVEQHEWAASLLFQTKASLRARLLEHPWLPATLFASLQDLLPGAVFVADTGSFCTIAEHLWSASEPNGFLCSANGRYMGTSVPMAIGAALADPSRPVICAMGDGGVRMYFAELKLAVEHNLPILFLFLSDGQYASIAAAIPEADRLPSVLSMKDPSWFQAAQALGCDAQITPNASAFREAAQRWHSRGAAPAFLEARFDSDSYLKMTADLR